MPIAQVQISKTIVFTTQHPALDDVEFRYNGSLTINVWVIDPDGVYQPEEIEVLTLSEAGEEHALERVREYVEEFLNSPLDWEEMDY